MKEASASYFKARCLAILDEVAETGETYVVLKHGRPVARVMPPAAPLGSAARYPQELLRDTVEILGDIVSPPLPASAWKATRRTKR